MKKSPSACDHNLFKTVVRTIEQHGMFEPGDRVLAGVSGGPDSVALVHILVRLAERFSLTIGIAHLNHCLRGLESDRDARFVAELAKRLHLPCYSTRKDVGRCRQAWKLSPEEAARRARYEFFEETAARHRFNKIALGHHADDNAELVLMYLLRGSGPLGISGIPPVREGRYVRPMMELGRRRIIEFLSENSISCITDSSNTDTRYLRNRIRHQLIPHLRNEYNPDISRTLNRLADILRAEEAWLAPTVRELFGRCLLTEGPDRVVLSVPELRKMTVAPRRRVIRTAILQVKGNLRRISLAHVDRLALEILNGDAGAARTAHLPARMRATRTGSELCIVLEKTPLRQANPSPPALLFHYQVAGPMDRLNRMDHIDLWVEEISRRLRFSVIAADAAGDWTKAPPDTAFFDLAEIRFPLVVRNVRNGDRFTPLGLKGTQKLKAYFINNKIPIQARRRCPILVSREEIIWIAGHRVADSARVTASSKNLLRVQLLLA